MYMPVPLAAGGMALGSWRCQEEIFMRTLFESTTPKVSFASWVVSPMMVIEIGFETCPGAKSRVPVFAT